MIKDFVPASSTLDTGIIIKPHLLNRSKIKSPKLTGTRPEYSASIDMVNTTGSDGGSYDTTKSHADLQKELESYWPAEMGGRSNFIFKPDFSAPNSPNPGEIVVAGTEFYHPDGNLYTFRDIPWTVYTSYEGSVNPAQDFYLMFSSESISNRFDLSGWQINSFTNKHQHIIPVDYSPHGQNSWVARDNNNNNSASFSPLPSDVLIAGFTLGTPVGSSAGKLSKFSNYTKPLETIIPGKKTTIYKQNIPTVNGNVRKWVEDESPKITGELSGSIIEVTDGELNKTNVFKQVDIPPLNYDILKVDEGSAATYTSFQMDKDTAKTSAALQCANTSFINDTLYHNDTGSFPATIGSFVFTDIAGSTTFAGDTGDKWYQLGNLTVARISGSAGGNAGYVGEIIPCSNFDSTAPAGYRARWNQNTLNATNFTVAGLTIHHNSDGAATWEATASIEATGASVFASGSILYPTQSVTIDTTLLADAANIFLNVKLTDSAGNTGLAAAVIPDPDNNLTCSIKDVVVPTGYTVDCKANFNYNTSATEYNSGNFYIQTAGIPTGERGNINYVLSSTGGGQNLIVQRAFNNTGGSLPTSNLNVSSNSHGLQPGTLTVSASLTDVAGNIGATVTDSVSLANASATLDNASFINQMNISSNNQYATLRVRNATPSTLQWTVTENATWAQMLQHSGTGNDSSVQVYLSTNSTGNNRSVTFILASAGTNLDSFIITQYAAGNTNDCVAPFTKILMSDGSEKLAQEVQVGDEIRTKQELTLENTNARVNKKQVTDSKRIKIILDENEIVCSPKHRFYVDNKSDYIAADLLEEGDLLSNQKYIKTEEYAQGDVIEFSIEHAQTYISNGILSHNNKGIQ